MSLGMEVDLRLGPGEFVFDEDPAPSQRKAQPPPNFWPMSIVAKRLDWPNGWMDEDATWYESRSRPRPHYVRRGPSSPAKRHSSLPLFGPCLLWPRSLISATVELLFDQRTAFVTQLVIQ